MSDPVGVLAHDHADLNRRVLALGTVIRKLEGEPGVSGALIDSLTELRELLFLHFAREEEGLFPFVAEHVPDLADQAREMAVAHDAICGALARMFHLASAAEAVAAIAPVFERFEASYASHAATEARLLEQLAPRLAPEARDALTSILADV